MTRVAIIGAGLSGLSLARQLVHSADVTLFEKSRGVGGRMATRRIGQFQFDHGAQYFTARSKDFKNFLQPYINNGDVVEWQPRVLTLEHGKKPYKRDWFEAHYVAVPGMNALCKNLAEGLDIRMQTHVSALRKISASKSAGWRVLIGDNEHPDDFDLVISTAPALQTLALFRGHLAETLISGNDSISDARLSPCFTLMLGLAEMPVLKFDAARVKHMALEWIMVDSSKPGRPAAPCLVLLSTNEWAAQHQDADEAWVIAHLMTELESLLEGKLPTVQAQSLQRWRYARVEQALEDDYLLDPENNLAACGDWCMAERVEGAFLSASRLAARLEASL